MPSPTSLIHVQDLDYNDLHRILRSAQNELRRFNGVVGKKPQRETPRGHRYSSLVALVFLEASTRTRMSFETAALRTGRKVVLFDSGHGTSLGKGETELDTLLNICATGPDLLVVRCGDGFDLSGFGSRTGIPILNAGWGKREHPTQAMLDALTLLENREIEIEDLRRERILLVGDLKHSRVVGSHLSLSRTLGYTLGMCAPEGFLPSKPELRENAKLNFFSSLEEGMSWASTVMFLRVQKERHGEGSCLPEDYAKKFGLNSSTKRFLKSEHRILHPGPVNHGVEFDFDIEFDPRCLILDQVRSGVALRGTLLDWALGEQEY